MDGQLKNVVLYTNEEAYIIQQIEAICKSKEDAIIQAKLLFNNLSPRDKKRVRIIAGVCNIDHDDYAIDRFDEYDTDIYQIHWDSKEVIL